MDHRAPFFDGGGIPVVQFLSQFGAVTFLFEYEGLTYKHDFTAEEVEAQVRRLDEELKPQPARSTAGAQIAKPETRVLTTYETEQKLRAIDKVLDVLANDMEPLVANGSGLQTGWWNAIKDPKNHPTYKDDLLKYRDLLVDSTTKLENIRSQLPQYQDLIVAAQPTFYNDVKKAFRNSC